jgi:hypothetical protein
VSIESRLRKLEAGRKDPPQLRWLKPGEVKDPSAPPNTIWVQWADDDLEEKGGRSS